MEFLYRSAMRNGSKLLFALALVQLAAALASPLQLWFATTSAMMANHSYFPGQDGFWSQVSLFLQSLGSVAVPLFFALLVHRADRWLAVRETVND